MEHGLGEIQALGDYLSVLGTVMSWHNQGTLVTSLLWNSAWGLASASPGLNLYQKCCIFQEEKNEDLTQKPTYSPDYHYDCHTRIATNMLYFFSMSSCPLSWTMQGLTKAEDVLRRNNALAHGGCTK